LEVGSESDPLNAIDGARRHHLERVQEIWERENGHLDMALPLRNIPRTGHFEFDAGPHFLKGWNQNPFQVEETGGKILEEAADQRKARRAFGEQGEGKKGIREHGGGTGRPDIPMIAAAFESKTGLIKNFLRVDPGPL
jgi:hypothetical protein